MRTIPIKNYIIVFIIALITVLVTFKLMDKYNKRESKLDFINEIKEADLDYYIAENNSVLIYLTTAKKSKNIEREFKKYLKNKDIKNSMIYIDLNETSEIFEDDFNKKFSKNKIEINDPTLVSIEESKVDGYINNIHNFDQIKEFIESKISK